jgi:AraC-like DNA-binding protein
MVHSFWQVEGKPDFHRELILPKGNIEIIFNFSDKNLFMAKLAANAFSLPKCFINGFNTTPIILTLPENQSFFGVRLHALAVKQLINVPASAFLDIIVDLTLIDRNFNTLWHQLAEENVFEKRITIFYNYISKNTADPHPREALINNFLSGIDQHVLSVTQLSGILCYSSRQLSRKIFEASGMNTETMLLYKKYLHTVHLVHHTALSLTEIAYLGNFSDQSHFIRTFRLFTGLTPGEYRRNKSYLTGHLFEDVR